MEREILLDAIGSVRGSAIDGTQRGLHGGHRAPRAAQGGKRRDLGLEGASQFVEFLQRGAGFVDFRIEPQRRERTTLRHEESGPLHRHDEPLRLQSRDGFAHHGTTDAESFGHRGLGGQAAAGRKALLGDRRAQLVRHTLREALAAADEREFGSLHRPDAIRPCRPRLDIGCLTTFGGAWSTNQGRALVYPPGGSATRDGH